MAEDRISDKVIGPVFQRVSAAAADSVLNPDSKLTATGVEKIALEFSDIYGGEASNEQLARVAKGNIDNRSFDLDASISFFDQSTSNQLIVESTAKQNIDQVGPGEGEQIDLASFSLENFETMASLDIATGLSKPPQYIKPENITATNKSITDTGTSLGDLTA